jgi:hypothetical protein
MDKKHFAPDHIRFNGWVRSRSAEARQVRTCSVQTGTCREASRCCSTRSSSRTPSEFRCCSTRRREFQALYDNRDKTSRGGWSQTGQFRCC